MLEVKLTLKTKQEMRLFKAYLGALIEDAQAVDYGATPTEDEPPVKEPVPTEEAAKAVDAAIETATEKRKRLRRERDAKRRAEKKAAEAKAKANEDEDGSEDGSEDEDVTIEGLRALLQKVLSTGGDRKAVKAKLTKLGATSLTTLDASKYEAMHDFLTSL